MDEKKKVRDVKSTPNTSPEGIRYGVISMQSIDPDVASELWHGPQAVDLSYQGAYIDAKYEAECEFDSMMEECEIAASETDHRMTEEERGDFIEDKFRAWAEAKHYPLTTDRDDFVSLWLEQWSDCVQIEEPTIEGTYEGVRYQISWLGGAPLLWVFEGPLGFAERLCSPCVPGAADLEGGFEPTSISLADIHKDHDGYLCYVVPQDWLYKEPA